MFYGSNTQTKTLSFTSGKGGVGKTTVLANVALQFARHGRKVLIFDGDLGMANVDILFGVKTTGSLHEVISGQKDVSEILTEVASNVFLLPGGNGVLDYNRLNIFERRALLDSVSQLQMKFDYLLIDTAPGISDNVLYLNAAAQLVNVIITPDPASLTDAYALIKVLNSEYKESRFNIICNQVRDEVEGVGLFNRFNDVVARFLNVSLDFVGSVPADNELRRANQAQRLILRHDVNSPSAIALTQLANRLHFKSQKTQQKGGLQFFWEQVVGVA